MKDRFKEVFDQVQASEELKDRTKSFLAKRTRRYTSRAWSNYPLLISTAACLLFMVMGGHWLYFTQTAKISVDVNPSIELGINRFDRVISVGAFNEDGRELADALKIRYINYVEAVNQILESESVAALLSGDEVMVITVIGEKERQSVRILSGVESCAAGHQNTYCYSANAEEVHGAHQMGLSCGKYRVFLELQALDPDVTPEEIRGMTMREIRERIASLQAENGEPVPSQGTGERGHHGAGHGRRNGRGHHQ